MCTHTVILFLVTPKSHLWPLMGLRKKKKKDGAVPYREISLTDVYKLVKFCTRRFQNRSYEVDVWVTETQAARITFEKPFLELFLWAVFVCRIELALLLWDYLVEEPLTMALVGTILCDVLEEEITDFGMGTKERFLQLKAELEERASGLVNQAYVTNKEKALLLIQRPSKTWGNLSSLALAALASDRTFLSTPCCQNAIFKVWKRGFDAGAIRITLCTYTVLPILIFVKFDHDENCPMGQCPPFQCSCDRGPDVMDMSDACGRVAVRPGLRSVLPPYYAVQMRSKSYPRRDANEDFIDGTTTHDWRKYQRTSIYVGPSMSVDQPASHCGEEINFVKRISWIRKILTFYSAPIVKFTNHTLWYIFYLLLYGYVILFAYGPGEPYRTELILYCWQLTLIFEEIRDLLTYPGDNLVDKAEDYWYFSSFGTWNRLDVLSMLMSCVAFSLRWSPMTFPVARLLMVVTLVLYIIRVFKIYFVNSYLGPKVIMLKRMSWDLAMFLLVMVVFLISYSVSAQALLKQNEKFHWGVFYDLFLTGIWEIFGELNDEEMKGIVDGCPAPNKTWSTTGWDVNCSMRSWPVPFFLAVYLFFGSILMINMLIAVFTHVFDEVQKNSEEIWKYEMFFLVEEFKKKPLLPPPFIILEHVYLVVKWLRKTCKDKPKQVVIGGRKLGRRELEFLEIFEKVCRSDFIDYRRRTQASQLENKIEHLQEEVTKISEILLASGYEDGGRRSMVHSESQQHLRSVQTSLEDIRKISGDV